MREPSRIRSAFGALERLIQACADLALQWTWPPVDGDIRSQASRTG
jgi:hypothetical protein